MIKAISVLLLACSANGQTTAKVKQITHGPAHHFFGYVGHGGTIPWNASPYLRGMGR